MAENRPTLYLITYERKYGTHYYVMTTMVDESKLDGCLKVLNSNGDRNVKHEKTYPILAVNQD